MRARMARSGSAHPGGLSEEEVERLASRLALLVSDAGEADNAGRAVGVLARRLGVSGGQLKAIFLAGAASAGPDASRAAAQATRIRQLEHELAEVRAALHEAEAGARVAERECDVLRGESVALHAALNGQRTGGRARAMLLAALLLGVAGALALLVYLPNLQWGPDAAPAATGAPNFHEAVVHERGTALRRDPSVEAPVLMHLAAGAHLTVHRMLWYNLMQWIEVEYGGQTGYVVSTEVDLS
jgi:hypothetical protein